MAGIKAGYRACWEQIAATNLQMLRRVTAIAAVIHAMFLAFAIVASKPVNMVVAYAAGFAVQVIFAVLLRAFGARLVRRTRVIRALCVLFQILSLSVVVYIGAIAMHTEPGIYFSPITIVVSMLFVLPFWHNVTFVTLTTAAFVLLSNFFKEQNVFLLDVSMAVLTWVLSLTTNFVVLELRVRDMNQRRELMLLSCTDSLTGLLNKTKAESAAREYLAGQGSQGSCALFVIDLDQFKQINDQMGHQAGDAALEVFGESLMKLFRTIDIVGRVGGDEFVALMKNTSDRRLVARRAALICETVRRTHFRDTGITLTCSVGVAICEVGNCRYDELFKKADEQLYIVKRGGKDGFHIA
jgi:diguanylate cyclase (GGDEF)-like protein